MGPINIAECVGLWLAEGDSKSKYEVAFTNNKLSLIKLFHRTIKELFKNNNFRLYVYSSSKINKNIGIAIKLIKFYRDKRATKPYFILRLANRNIVTEWHKIVRETIKNKKYYEGILRGFFAGEGNIKEGSHNSRQIRIAQKQPNPIVESILKYFDISFRFFEKERSYVISGRNNWEKFFKLKIANLHSEKNEKFMNAYSNFKQWHYSRGYLKNNIYKILGNPYTTRQLSKIFNRSFARIQDSLIALKKENKILNYRIGSIDYWIRNDENKILISKRKNKILSFIQKPKTTKEVSNKFNVSWKASFRRLNELYKLGLVLKDNNKWVSANIDKEVVCI